jgi:hypothetical protein
MHATADTIAVKFLPRCGAARDARRYAASPPFIIERYFQAILSYNAYGLRHFPKEKTKMPNIEINIYLSNGGKALIKLENVTLSVSTVEGQIQSQMKASGDTFRYNSPKAVISLKKSEIVGFSVDES